FLGRQLCRVAAASAILERDRYPERSGFAPPARRGRSQRTTRRNQEFARAHLFSAGANLCQPGGRNFLRDSDLRDGPIDQAQQLPAIERNNRGGLAEATQHPTARGERTEPVQILGATTFAD